MKTFKKLCLTVFAVLAFSSVITACHTVHGVGQDVQSGGAAISRAAS